MPPIELPSDINPARIIETLTDDQVLTAGFRVTSFRVELLSNNENFLGNLVGVKPGGSLEWTANASVKGSGSITVTDLQELVNGSAVDWLNVRIRPIMIIEGYSSEIPLGVWLPALPTESWSSEGRVWEVELHDKLSILDGDPWTDPDTGLAVTFSLEQGTNVIETVKTLITETGESVAAIEPGSETLTRSMVWEPGTTRLAIINDLLDAANYFSLYTDMAGQYRADKYVEPASRPVIYETANPLSASESGVWSPAFTVERDIYTVPNRVVCIGQGSADTEAISATATNLDPASPFSYPNRGRWITRIESGVEATSQAALDSYAKRLLISSTAVTAGYEITHAFLPDLTINSVIRLTNPGAGVSTLATVSATSVPLDPLAFCSTSLREVVNL